MRWFVTGGCGFIGANLVRALAAAGGQRIRVLDNLSTGALDALGRASFYTVTTSADLTEMDSRASHGVEFIDGDVVDGPLVLKAATGADVIVHLAANTEIAASLDEPGLDCAVNVFGTLSVLEAARRNRTPRVVFASARTADRPASPNAASKLAAEAYCIAYNRSFGLETVVLRLADAFGPGSARARSIVADIIWRQLVGEDTGLASTHDRRIDLVYVDDVVRAIRWAATARDASCATFDIGSGAPATIAEIEDRVSRALAAEGFLSPVRNRADAFGHARRPALAAAAQPAIGSPGWCPECDLDDALRRTVAWFAPGWAYGATERGIRNPSVA